MTTHATVRAATMEDLPALQSLARKTINACYRGFLGDDAVDGFIGSGASDGQIASHLPTTSVLNLGGASGIAGLATTSSDTLDLLMVDPDRARLGLGTFLLDAIEASLFARYERIRLETFADNAVARAFYVARGWMQVKAFALDGFERVEYQKRSRR